MVAFTGALGCNELIFQLSGENVVFFNGKRMNMRPNYIRFLPEGEVSQYIVKRDKYGDWYLWYNGRKGSKEQIGLVIKKGPDIFE